MRQFAVVGSGPAGFYTAEALEKAYGDQARIDIIDRYPVPYGLIRFGSRVDLYLPPGSSVLVHPGQRTVGGETPLARLPLGAPPVAEIAAVGAS